MLVWGLVTVALGAAGEGAATATGQPPYLQIVLTLITATAGVIAAWVASSRRSDRLDQQERAELQRLRKASRRGRNRG